MNRGEKGRGEKGRGAPTLNGTPPIWITPGNWDLRVIEGYDTPTEPLLNAPFISHSSQKARMSRRAGVYP